MNIDWKQALVSIFIGSVIAFFTVFVEGLLEYLRGLENNLLGGLGSGFWYAIKNHRTIL